MIDKNEALDRARRAKAIIEDPLFTEAVNDVRTAIMSAWSRTGLDDTPERDRLWMMEQALQRVVHALRSRIETGKVVRADIERERTGLRKVIGL